MANTKKTATKKTTRKTRSKKTAEKMSQLAAAERVLKESRKPLNCKAMVEKMEAKGYWKSPGGKTPDATLYASLLRHIRKHGKDARFQKTGPGQFSLKK